jgi:hypothetical protein
MHAATLDELEDKHLLVRLRRVLTAADRFAAEHRPAELLSGADQHLVLALMADLALATAALARRSGELEQRIAGVSSGLRAASSYQRTIFLTRPRNGRR